MSDKQFHQFGDWIISIDRWSLFANDAVAVRLMRRDVRGGGTIYGPVGQRHDVPSEAAAPDDTEYVWHIPRGREDVNVRGIENLGVQNGYRTLKGTRWSEQERVETELPDFTDGLPARNDVVPNPCFVQVDEWVSERGREAETKALVDQWQKAADALAEEVRRAMDCPPTGYSRYSNHYRWDRPAEWTADTYPVNESSDDEMTIEYEGIPGMAEKCWADVWHGSEDYGDYESCNADPDEHSDLGLCSEHLAKINDGVKA